MITCCLFTCNVPQEGRVAKKRVTLVRVKQEKADRQQKKKNKNIKMRMKKENIKRKEEKKNYVATVMVRLSYGTQLLGC